jgi:hypothetical protein
MHAFVDQGPDRGTKRLWSLAKQLHPDIGGSEIRLVGVDDVDEEISIPLRPLLRALYQLRRMRMIKELGILLMFYVGLWLSTSYFFNIQDVFEQDEALFELFWDEEFPTANHKKTFTDIHAVGEFYQWAKGPLLAGIYEKPVAHPGEADYLSTYLRLVGPVRLRQFRVGNGSCVLRRNVEKYGARYDNVDGTCYREFDLSYSDPAPFGPRGVFGQGYYGAGNRSTANETTARKKYQHARAPYAFSTAVGRSEFSRSAVPTQYGKGGFPVYLPPPSALAPFNKSTNVTARALLSELEQDRWIGKATRAVFVEFNVYCTETNLLSANQYYCEFLHSGYIGCSQRVRSYRAMFDGTRDYSQQGIPRFMSELVTCFTAVYMLRRVLSRIWRAPILSQYFSEWTNYFEIFLLLSYFFHLATVWLYIFGASGDRAAVDVTNGGTFLEIFDDFEWLFLGMEAAGACACLCVFLLLRQCQCSRRTAILQMTISNASQDLLLFMGLIMVLIFGFAKAAHLLYGPYLQPFMTFWSSMREMLAFMIDGYDYQLLARVAPYWSFFFYWIWLFLVYLIMMNMFIAILTDGYRAARDSASSELWLYDVPTLVLDFQKLLAVTHYKVQRAYLHSCCFNVLVYSVCCCKCGGTAGGSRQRRGRGTKNRRFDSRSSGSFGIDLLEGAMNPETADEQLQHWILEDEFQAMVYRAKTRAKVTRNAVGVQSLFKYVRSAYEHKTRTNRTNQYIGVKELCLVTTDVDHSMHCDHSDPKECLALALILSYQKGQSIFLVRGTKREELSRTAITNLEKGVSEFEVEKINAWGRKQQRIMVIDANNAVVRTFDTARKLRRVLHLSKLEQIDISKASQNRLKLSFEQGYVGHCVLLFKNEQERKSFVHRILAHSIASEGGDVRPDFEDDRVSLEMLSDSVAAVRKAQKALEEHVRASNANNHRILAAVAKHLDVDVPAAAIAPATRAAGLPGAPGETMEGGAGGRAAALPKRKQTGKRMTAAEGMFNGRALQRLASGRYSENDGVAAAIASPRQGLMARVYEALSRSPRLRPKGKEEEPADPEALSLELMPFANRLRQGATEKTAKRHARHSSSEVDFVHSTRRKESRGHGAIGGRGKGRSSGRNSLQASGGRSKRASKVDILRSQFQSDEGQAEA